MLPSASPTVYPFIQGTLALHAACYLITKKPLEISGHFSYQTDSHRITPFIFKQLLFYLIISPKHRVLKKSFFYIYLILCVQLFCLNVYYICVPCACLLPTSQKRALGPLELELQMVTIRHVGAGNRKLYPLQEQEVLLVTKPVSQAPKTHISNAIL